MEITNVLAGVAVRDLDRAKRWYEVLFARPVDAEPMSGLAEWHTPGGVLQLVLDEQRAGGSLVTIWVPDARNALADLASRSGPEVELSGCAGGGSCAARRRRRDCGPVGAREKCEGKEKNAPRGLTSL